MSPSEPIDGAEPANDRSTPINPLSAFAEHPTLSRAFLLLNSHVLMATSLSHRHRELLALRTAAQCSSGYEWIRQLFLGREGALDDEEVFRIAFGADPAFWSEFEATLLLATDDLIRDRAISESAMAALARELDTDQILDVIFVVRTYETLAIMMRSVGVEPDEEFRHLRN